jgi:hypothetical protein
MHGIARDTRDTGSGSLGRRHHRRGASSDSYDSSDSPTTISTPRRSSRLYNHHTYFDDPRGFLYAGQQSPPPLASRSRQRSAPARVATARSTQDRPHSRARKRRQKYSAQKAYSKREHLSWKILWTYRIQFVSSGAFLVMALMLLSRPAERMTSHTEILNTVMLSTVVMLLFEAVGQLLLACSMEQFHRKHLEAQCAKSTTVPSLTHDVPESSNSTVSSAQPSSFSATTLSWSNWNHKPHYFAPNNAGKLAWITFLGVAAARMQLAMCLVDPASTIVGYSSCQGASLVLVPCIAALVVGACLLLCSHTNGTVTVAVEKSQSTCNNQRKERVAGAIMTAAAAAFTYWTAAIVCAVSLSYFSYTIASNASTTTNDIKSSTTPDSLESDSAIMLLYRHGIGHFIYALLLLPGFVVLPAYCIEVLNILVWLILAM